MRLNSSGRGPERFSSVDCSLCHGQGAKTGKFQMPTTRLKLDRLVPLMAEALGKKPFSIITRRGFGCYSCHLGPSGPMFGN